MVCSCLGVRAAASPASGSAMLLLSAVTVLAETPLAENTSLGHSVHAIMLIELASGQHRCGCKTHRYPGSNHVGEVTGEPMERPRTSQQRERYILAPQRGMVLTETFRIWKATYPLAIGVPYPSVLPREPGRPPVVSGTPESHALTESVVLRCGSQTAGLNTVPVGEPEFRAVGSGRKPHHGRLCV